VQALERYSWAPRPDLSPAFTHETVGGEEVWRIDSAGDYARFGYWKHVIGGIEGLGTYTFTCDYRPRHIQDEDMSVVAIVTWQDESGEMLTRDYLGNGAELADGAGWKRMQRTIDAPAGAVSVSVDLGLRWTAGGIVEWRTPAVVRTEPIKHRIVRAATTYLEYRRENGLEERLRAMIAVVDEAGKLNPDIICLSEVYYDRGIDVPFAEIETVPGRLTAVFSEKARQYGTYIVLCLREREGDRLYVTAVLIDRNGRIAGKYRKTHIPLCEAESGISAGTEYPVFDTDFGKIGMLICFDLLFPETARLLASRGAEIIFHPTIGDAPLAARARAADNGIHVVVSGTNEPSSSMIIDPLGEVIGAVEQEGMGVCMRELDLDKRHYVYWMDVGPAYGETRQVFNKQKRTAIRTM
jgi:predicted amidohydrolase